jgi:polyisoprenoid-binding protein YceI
MRLFAFAGLACLTLAAAFPINAWPQSKTPSQAKVPIAPPRQVTLKASKDPAAAPAGTYALDPRQVSVLVRVVHDNGFSYSVFRMGDVAGVLSWDPSTIENSKVNIRIATKSLQTNVPGFAEQLTGPDFLNAALFPDASFISTDIKRTGPTTAKITGAFTLHGVTRPLVLDTEMVGAGPALRGPAIGFHAQGVFHRLDFGVGPVSPMIGDEVEVIVDLEFDKVS